MGTSPAGTPLRLSWLAVIITFVLLVPGEFAGAVVGFLYRLILHGYIFSGDTLFDTVTHGWFSKVGLEGVSNAIVGGTAGFVAAAICYKLTKHANFKLVAYINSALVTLFTVVALVFDLAVGSLKMDDFAILANTAGVVIGLFIANNMISETKRAQTAITKHADTRPT